ncbi:hypothetical protein PoB_005279200 [Plakobranchus ocellatus]|uniref:TIR domain-containing protein n=1 Tax=Plakobranchus ocellatus TaxID=259542 RepID=A0AAV4C4J1_9GAST|nr:hypothetical protein PoB_005279200 [Plakobranchus ocellatus]
MGTGPSTPGIRQMNTSEAVQSMPRLTVTQQVSPEKAADKTGPKTVPVVMASPTLIFDICLIYCENNALLNGWTSDEAEVRTEATDGDSEEKKKIQKKESPEEVAEKFQAGLKKIQAKCELLLTVKPRDLEQEGAPFTHDFRQCVLVFATSYFYFKIGEIPMSEILRYRASVGEFMCQPHVIKTLLDSVADGLKRRDFFDESGKMLKEFWFPMKNMLLTLVNYSDFVSAIKFNIAEHEALIPQLLTILESHREAHMNKTQSEEQEKLVKWCLSILHNCGSLEENVPTLRDHGTIPLLLTYTDSPAATIRLSTLATLADLVNESEAELLRANPKNFRFILQKLEKALKTVNHRDVGWSAAELVRAIRQLARNDANKAILVDQGCLPVLLETVQVGDETELQEALDCLWILSFDDSNKQHIESEPGLIQAVWDMYHAVSGKAQHTCQGILWSMRDTLQESTDFKHIAEEIMSIKSQATPKHENIVVVEDAVEGPEGSSFQGHVMISYQWANQEIIKRICSELRAHGIPVWIDIDYMGGSTLQAMAQAVEDSFAVIIAMSQKYKDSPNTRAEAEYTFQQRKPIIPLIMQRGYKPDGWLGLILGSKLYYDFSGNYSFESRMDGLRKAVFTVAGRGTGQVDSVDQPLVATKAGAVALTSPSVLTPPTPAGHALSIKGHHYTTRAPQHKLDEQKISRWSQEDVSKWLSKYKLDESALKDVTGEEIVFLYNLKYEAPEFFYNCLDKKLHISLLMDLANATKAFKDLSTHT